MNQSNSSKQVLLSVIGVAILVVAVVGVSFAFFNYTRTGPANEVRTGNIVFTSSQDHVNVTNVFPVTRATALGATFTGSTTDPVAAATTSDANVGMVQVTIHGQTTYNRGLNFKVSVGSITNIGASNGAVPLSVLVSTDGNLGQVLPSNASTTTAFVNGTAGSIAVTSYEPSDANGTGLIAANSILADGFIDTSEATTTEGVTTYSKTVDQTILIKAFIDQSKVAISDTLTTDTAPEGYTNGTTATGDNNWLNGRTRLTTEQWNNLASNPASFTIKVEAAEVGGTWTNGSAATIRTNS